MGSPVSTQFSILPVVFNLFQNLIRHCVQTVIVYLEFMFMQCLYLCLLRVRRFSTLFPPHLPTWHCLNVGAPRPIRTKCSLATKWTCVTSAPSNRETPSSSRQVSTSLVRGLPCYDLHVLQGGRGQANSAFWACFVDTQMQFVICLNNLHHNISLGMFFSPGERPYLTMGERPDLSMGERHDLSMGERHDLSMGERHDLSMGERPDLSMGERHDLSMGERHDLSMGEREREGERGERER